MTRALVLLLAMAAVTEASNLAAMDRNRATVSSTESITNRSEMAMPEDRFEPDYEDFDDADEIAERQQSPIGGSGSILTYVNGIVSLLSLAYQFGGGHRKRRSAGEARYVPDAATKKFKQQADQEANPIGNFPPYDPLLANSAESYAQNGGKTSFDADRDQYKTADYTTIQQGTGGWSAIAHDYPVYDPMKTWQKTPEAKQPWQTPEEYPSLQDKPHVDFPEYIIHDDDPHHYHHHQQHEVEDEDRESKRPYSYYFLGRKLWYIPLIFSVYFIIYIAALVLKSVARHKIQFPDKLWDLKDEHYKHRRYRKVDDIMEKYENAIDKVKNKFM